MYADNERYTIVFNGEIYNYIELRDDKVGFAEPQDDWFRTENLEY